MPAPAAQLVIDRLAERLRRSVVIDDPGVRLLYASRHFGDEDDVRTHAVLQRQASSAAVGHVLAQGVAGWTTPGVIPAADGIGMRSRVCCPLRRRGLLIGLLLVIDAEQTLTPAELDLVTAAADELVPLLAAERAAEPDATADLRRAQVADLLTGAEPVRRAALGDLAGTLRPEELARPRVVALRVPDGSGDPSHVATALRLALDGVGDTGTTPGLVALPAPGEGAVVLGSGGSGRAVTEEQATALGARLVARVAEVAAGRFRCVAGVGAEADGLERAWESAEQAVLACRAAEQDGTDVRTWSSLGALAVLLHLPPGRLGTASLPAELQRVLAADRDGRLVETLRAFLAHAGAIPATADALHVHRTTLYYRLGRIRDVARVDLDDGGVRLALHLGLTLMDRPGLLRP